MNKFTKSILALGLALSIIVSVGGVSVFAASQKRGNLNGYSTIAVSTIAKSSAYASTQFATNGKRSVTSTYVYVNTTTLAGGRSTKDFTSMREAKVSFVAPKGCRSVKISSSHYVEAFDKRWTANTSAVY